MRQELSPWETLESAPRRHSYQAEVQSTPRPAVIPTLEILRTKVQNKQQRTYLIQWPLILTISKTRFGSRSKCPISDCMRCTTQEKTLKNKKISIWRNLGAASNLYDAHYCRWSIISRSLRNLTEESNLQNISNFHLRYDLMNYFNYVQDDKPWSNNKIFQNL